MMQYKKDKDRIEVDLPGDFNLNAVRLISEQIGSRKYLRIDLSGANFVNSKAIIFLHKLMFGDKQVTVKLKDPPKLFFELLQALELHHVWKLEDIVEP